MMRGVLAIALLATAPALGQVDRAPAPPPSNRACLECHGQAHIATLPPADRRAMVTGAPAPSADDGPRLALFVTDTAFARTPHAALACVDCHRDALTLPHPATLAPVSCAASCHEVERTAYSVSIHAEALRHGDDRAPMCQDCHGAHDVRPRTDRDSPLHPLNAVRTCAACHEQHSTPTTNGESHGLVVTEYLESVHGQGVSKAGLTMAATCSDCHGHHDVRAAGDPLARTSRQRVPDTCGRCHLGVEEVYAQSVHGRALAARSATAPVCTDCHTGHRISRASSPEAHLDIIAECGDCHDRPEMSQGRRATFYETYRASYHGQVTRLGDMRAARCSDCHGSHDIQPLSDPDSRLHGDNLIETCRTCHPRANAQFVQFDPHADYRDRSRYPVLYGVWWYFIIVMSGAFGFFGLHSLLWFVRSVIERRAHGPAPAPTRPGSRIRRFTTVNRVNHALVIITFLGLVLTGIPLLFSDQPWARYLAGLIGGVHLAGILHRTLAILLMLNFVVHFYSLYRSYRDRPGLRRAWWFGPDSMLPRWKDVRDCVGMFRWFLRGGRMPRFGRWTYWEKFDYWAEIGGSGIIGASGLLLWFPEFFSTFLPGWVFNVAMIVHGYEALLALGFIFTIHFFNAHLRLDKFPVDDVIFTGSVSEDELRHERPEEYDRLVASGRLEALRVADPSPHQRRVAVLIGIVAMTIGIPLVVLIILAGLGRL